jgi:hypothetical protein
VYLLLRVNECRSKIASLMRLPRSGGSQTPRAPVIEKLISPIA